MSIKVLLIELPIQPAPVGIVTLKNRTLSPVAQLFVRHAREVAKPESKDRRDVAYWHVSTEIDVRVHVGHWGKADLA
jgi:hypothetical protein